MASTKCTRNRKLRARYPALAQAFDEARTNGTLDAGVGLPEYIAARGGRCVDRVKPAAHIPGVGECEVCGNRDVLVEGTGLCGPCCFGEWETAGGNF